MKTPATSTWIPGLILSVGWLSLSFAQTDTSLIAKPATDAAAPISSAGTTKTAEAVPGSSLMSAPKDFPPLPTPGAVIIKRQPPRIRLSPWTGEVVRLAESGIEAGVILAFIENSGTFNLGADQIVYLNDLGLSGDIINAMLQHDRELISGAKPLTITSEPDWQFSFDSVSADEDRVAGKALPRPSTLPTRPAEVVDPKISAGLQALQGINRPVTVAALGPWDSGLGNGSGVRRDYPTGRATTETAPLPGEPTTANRSTFNWQGQRSDGKRSSYPVREPYPVEITAPIVFLSSDSRIPNTLVVLGFPRSTP